VQGVGRDDARVRVAAAGTPLGVRAHR